MTDQPHTPNQPRGPRPYPGGRWWPLDGAIPLTLDDADNGIPDAGARTNASDEPPELEQHWQRLCAQNPRLFNGSLLAMDSFDPASGTLRYRRESFRRYIVQPEIDTGVCGLAVTGLLIAPGEDGTDRVLVARRSGGVQVHPNLWETAPSGSVPAPEPGEAITTANLAEHLALECREELGFEIAPEAARPLALIADDGARSVDVLFRVDLDRPRDPAPDAEHAWEYDGFAWLGPDEAARFDADRAGECIPPVRAIARTMGWSGPG